MRQFYLLFLLSLILQVSACGGGGGGGSSAVNSANGGATGGAPDPSAGFPQLLDIPANNQQLLSCKSPVALPANSTITGVVEYQRIPLSYRGLDYSAVENMPARGVVVQAVAVIDNSCSETVVATTLTNDSGEYGLAVDQNAAVCVEARAQLYRDGSQGGAGWDVQLVDNTRGKAAFYLTDHNTMATPNQQAVRNLLAASGAAFGSSVYSSERAAAPFAILDSICEVLDTLVAVDNDIALPKLLVNWSGNNITAEGDIAAGEIGGPFYRMLRQQNPNGGFVNHHEIYLLGDADNNTDEYDSHVIAHEFGHFVSSALSRFDALGGEHALGDRLDLRLAFEEGWADAFSGMALHNASSLVDFPSLYRDSLGTGQGSTFRFSLDRDRHSVAGWYSESSIYSILYNLFDSSNDGVVDMLSLGFAPIYNVLTNNAYKNSSSLVSIYTFINHLKIQYGNSFAIDQLVAGQDIEQVIDDFGSFEDAFNNDVVGRFDVDPVYHQLDLSTELTVCSNDQFGSGNKLSVNQYLRFYAPQAGSYRFQVSPLQGLVDNGQGSLVIYQRGERISGENAVRPGRTIQHIVDLDGDYVVVVADVNNLNPESDNTGRRCFKVRVD